MKLEKDTIISHYKILSKIGKGGMGEVYLAQDTKKQDCQSKFESNWMIFRLIERNLQNGECLVEKGSGQFIKRGECVKI